RLGRPGDRQRPRVALPQPGADAEATAGAAAQRRQGRPALLRGERARRAVLPHAGGGARPGGRRPGQRRLAGPGDQAQQQPGGGAAQRGGRVVEGALGGDKVEGAEGARRGGHDGGGGVRRAEVHALREGGRQLPVGERPAAAVRAGGGGGGGEGDGEVVVGGGGDVRGPRGGRVLGAARGGRGGGEGGEAGGFGSMRRGRLW